MNKARRTQLKQAAKSITNAISIVDSVCMQEERALDNIPENLQDTDRYEAIEENVDTLSDVSSELGEILDTLNDML